MPGAARLLAQIPGLNTWLFNRLSRAATQRSELIKAVSVEEIVTDKFVERVRANSSGLSAVLRTSALAQLPEQRTPRLPVLLIWGEEDIITPVRVGLGIQSHIPGARFSEIAGCGHMPHLESTEVFVFQVRAFLNEIDNRRRPDASPLN